LAGEQILPALSVEERGEAVQAAGPEGNSSDVGPLVVVADDGSVVGDVAPGLTRSSVMNVVTPPPARPAPPIRARAAMVAAGTVRACHDHANPNTPATIVRPPAITVARPVPATRICAMVAATPSQAATPAALAGTTLEDGGAGWAGEPDNVGLLNDQVGFTILIGVGVRRYQLHDSSARSRTK
jgi:hypothetical protein